MPVDITKACDEAKERKAVAIDFIVDRGGCQVTRGELREGVGHSQI